MNSKQQPMLGVWSSLLWKEWNELKWKLIVLLIFPLLLLVVFISGIGYFAEYIGEDFISESLLNAMIAVLMCYCALAGAILGMHVAGRERGRNTLPYLQSLPSPMSRVGLVKLGMAITTAVVPLLVLVAVCVFYFISMNSWKLELEVYSLHWNSAETVNIFDWAKMLLIVFLPTTISLLLWMAVGGMNRSDEVRAGAIGFLVASLTWVPLGFASYYAEYNQLTWLWEDIEILMAAAPGGFVSLWKSSYRYDSGRLWPCMVVWFIGHGCLIAWYLRRYGRVQSKPERSAGMLSSAVLSQTQIMKPPMRSQAIAIAWKQFRETGPLSLIIACGIFVIATTYYLFNKDQISARSFAESVAGMSMTICFFVTVISGLGVFFEDFKPRVDDFWRSRPLNFPLWFGVKFLTGVLVLIVSFGTLFLFADWLSGWNLLVDEPEAPIIALYVGMCFLLVYTLSMASYCTLRQPIYAMVLTLGLCLFGILTLNTIMRTVFSGMDNRLAFVIFFGFLIFLQISTTAVAWRAVRANWGFRGS